MKTSWYFHIRLRIKVRVFYEEVENMVLLLQVLCDGVHFVIFLKIGRTNNDYLLCINMWDIINILRKT